MGWIRTLRSADRYRNDWVYLMVRPDEAGILIDEGRSLSPEGQCLQLGRQMNAGRTIALINFSNVRLTLA
jgi:hypothetical protein